MAARGRSAGFVMGPEHRDKIKKSNVLRNLINFAEGKDGVDMKPHQVTAAIALLKKVMPDVQPIDPETGQGGITLHLPHGFDKV